MISPGCRFRRRKWGAICSILHRPTTSEGLCISVVDVSGKGMQAAMAAVFTSGALASEFKQNTTPGCGPHRPERAVFHHSRRGHFVAFLSGCLHPRERIFTFANAGQTKPLLRRGSTVRWLDGQGPHFPLGMQAGTVYDDCRPGSSAGRHPVPADRWFHGGDERSRASRSGPNGSRRAVARRTIAGV